MKIWQVLSWNVRYRKLKNIPNINQSMLVHALGEICFPPLHSVYDPVIRFITARQWSCGNVMFSKASVREVGIHVWPLPMMPGTSLYTPLLDIRPGTPTFRHQPWDTPSMLLISGGQNWRPVQTCSLEEWHLVTNTGDLFKCVHLWTPIPRVTSGRGHWSTYGGQ